MKYWLLTSEYPPFYGGGISTYCYLTAKMLVQHRHEVTVFINDASIAGIVINIKEAVRIVRFNPSQTASASFLGYTTNISYEFAAVAKQFVEKEGAPDIIEAQEYLGIAYYLLNFKKLGYTWCRNIPVVITMHSPSFLYMEYNHVPLYRYPNYWICEMERFCLQAADLIVSPSCFMITELRKRFVLKNTNLVHIPNPFETSMLQQAVTLPSHKGEIVFFGKLTVQKGAFKLLSYFKRLWDDGFSRPLHLIGGQDIVYHPEGRSMGELIRNRYKPYVDAGLLLLEEGVKPVEIGNRLQAAEMVIIPSMNDNLPYVVFEMMALGKLVLVSKQGGHSEVIEHGIDGFIFDHDQPDTFQQQLDTILQLDAQARSQIAEKAIQKVRMVYSTEVVYAKKQEALSKLFTEPTQQREFPFIRMVGTEVAVGEMEDNLLTIVVPYYNMGTYIAETIKSIQDSDYPIKEIIIINDGSTDAASLAALQQYRNSNGIKVIDTENKGLAAARNTGAAAATGVFLAFLDADDKVAETYYSKAITVLKRYNNVHFVGCWTKYFEGSTKTWPTFTPEPPLILYHNQVNSSALVYKKESFMTAGKNAWDMLFQGWEDYESVIAMIKAGYPGVVLPEPLFQYRVRRRSMVRALSKSKKLLLYQYISSKHQDIYATFAAEIFNLATANGPGIYLDNPTLDYHLADRMPFGGKLFQKLIALSKKNKRVRFIVYKLYKLINR